VILRHHSSLLASVIPAEFCRLRFPVSFITTETETALQPAATVLPHVAGFLR